jgi:hypothetical protein
VQAWTKQQHQPQQLSRTFFEILNLHTSNLRSPANTAALCAEISKMGTGKKEASRKVRQGKVGDGMANVKVKGENFYRYVSGLVLQLRCAHYFRSVMVANLTY